MSRPDLTPIIQLFCYFSEPMAVYRKSAGGLSAKVTYEAMLNDLNIITWLKSLNVKSDLRRLKKYLQYSIFMYPAVIPVRAILFHFIKFAYYSFYDLKKDWKKIITTVFIVPKKTLKQFNR